MGPAFLFYFLFFINPFFQGFFISLTNWDGITSRTPISLAAEEFESAILDKVTSQGDKDFLLQIYLKDHEAGTYKRTELTGWDRGRVQGIIGATGWEPDKYKFVGLDNYAKVLAGDVDESFYPRTGELRHFQAQSILPNSFRVPVFEMFKDKFRDRPDIQTLAEKYYAKKNDSTYQLRPGLQEFEIQAQVRGIPGLDAAALEAFLKGVNQAGLEGQRDTLSGLKSTLVQTAGLDAAQTAVLDRATDTLYEMGTLKKVMSEGMVENKYQMGVLGFTLVFTILTVLLANFLAFTLAVALDKKIKSKNILRSVFFLPNIISLVIVAFIWSLIFGQLLPKITPVDVWMGNPDLAPYLVVLVAVWQGLGYYMVIYLAGLQSIPQEILEVASVDGAGSWRRLVNITIPLLLPAFTICLFLSIANALKSFDIVFSLVGPSGYAVNSVPVVMDIYFDAFARKLAGLSTAKAILLMAVIIIITGIQLTIMKKKEVEY